MALGIPDIAEGIKSLVKTLNPVVKESTIVAPVVKPSFDILSYLIILC